MAKRKVSSSKKTLKDQNRFQLWLIAAANGLLLYLVIQYDAIRLSEFGEIFADAGKLVPIGFATVFATVLNGFLSSEMKARLVFLRWENPLPGHRAFTVHARRDPRIDMAFLRRKTSQDFPTAPHEQNRLWYRLYKAVEDVPAVSQVHRDFLLTRDYTGLSAMFVVVFGGIGLYAIPSWRVAFAYCGLLIGQFAVVRLAAANYGNRLVTTVLATVAATEI